MRVIIMGCGRVGSELTVGLCEGGHDVAIIDKRESAFQRLPPGFNARTFVGLGFDRDVLQEAGIREAEAFIAVSSGDNSNIVSARVALEHYHVPKVIARIYDPRRAEIYERLNIPTVATTTWGVKQIQLMLFHDRNEIRETHRRRGPAAHARAGSRAPRGQVGERDRRAGQDPHRGRVSRAAEGSSPPRTARCRRATISW